MDCSPPGSSVVEFSRQEHWNVLPFPSLGEIPNPGIEAGSPALQADSLPIWATREVVDIKKILKKKKEEN